MNVPSHPPLDDKPSLRERLVRPSGTRRVQLAAGVLIAGILVLVVVLAGGGTSERDPGVEFRAQARTVCAAAQRQVAGLKTPSDLTDLVSVAHQAARISGRTRVRLAALTPPAAISARMPALLASLRRQQRLADQLAAAAARGSRSAARKLIARGRQEDVRTGRAAQRVGLQACATIKRNRRTR